MPQIEFCCSGNWYREFPSLIKGTWCGCLCCLCRCCHIINCIQIYIDFKLHTLKYIYHCAYIKMINQINENWTLHLTYIHFTPFLKGGHRSQFSFK